MRERGEGYKGENGTQGLSSKLLSLAGKVIHKQVKLKSYDHRKIYVQGNNGLYTGPSDCCPAESLIGDRGQQPRGLTGLDPGKGSSQWAGLEPARGVGLLHLEG